MFLFEPAFLEEMPEEVPSPPRSAEFAHKQPASVQSVNLFPLTFFILKNASINLVLLTQ